VWQVSQWRHTHPVNKIFSILLAIVILWTVGVVAYGAVNPSLKDTFTEFYFVPAQGGDYPRTAKLGTAASVTVGIVNQEQSPTAYWVEVRLNGVKNNDSGPIILQNGAKWVQSVLFTPARLGIASYWKSSFSRR